MAITEDKLRVWARRRKIKKLHKALLLHDPRLRAKVCIFLGILKDQSSLPHLQLLINDPSEEVLLYAMHAIERIDEEQTILVAFKETLNRRAALVRPQNGYAPQLSTREIDAYADMIGRRNRFDRIRSWIWAILCTIGLLLIGYLVYTKVSWRDFF